MIEIESGIPIPPKRSKYPLKELEVGQSFFAPTTPRKTNRQLQTAISAHVHYITKKTGKRFTSRLVEGGVRVWRIA